jgi:hypothetical protein
LTVIYTPLPLELVMFAEDSVYLFLQLVGLFDRILLWNLFSLPLVFVFSV